MSSSPTLTDIRLFAQAYQTRHATHCREFTRVYRPPLSALGLVAAAFMNASASQDTRRLDAALDAHLFRLQAPEWTLNEAGALLLRAVSLAEDTRGPGAALRTAELLLGPVELAQTGPQQRARILN